MSGTNKHYLYPSTIKLAATEMEIHTILGSCVAVCLFDERKKTGGMNHFMLPFWNGKGLASPKYGNIAIERLLARMLDNGSRRRDLVAKVFGGGNVLGFNTSKDHVGLRNAELAIRLLQDERIHIAAQSTGGEQGRKIIFYTKTGKVQQRYINRMKMFDMPVPEARQKLK